ETFDAAFRVMSHPAGLANELLDDRTRALAVENEEGFEIEGKTLTITFRGVPQEAAPLVALGRYGRAVVGRWAELARAPSAAAAALGLDPIAPGLELASEGATAVARGARRGHAIALSVLGQGPRCTTILSVGITGGAAFTLDRRTASPKANEGAVPPYARALAERATPSLLRLVGEPGRLTLELEGLAHDSNELERYVEAIIEATRAGSAYR
ncbi:MAG TPA: hypothetical protein VFS00_01740, partial [Polyangiaceae bacterium]|nr:hypothetical protein [Polyangiaceae bacterium]